MTVWSPSDCIRIIKNPYSERQACFLFKNPRLWNNSNDFFRFFSPLCVTYAAIWHCNFISTSPLTLKAKRSAELSSCHLLKKTNPDLSFGCQLDHRFPEVKFAVCVSHISVSSHLLPGSTGRIICLIHSAVRPLRSGAARKTHAHAASSVTTLTSRLCLIQTHISLFVCTKNKYEYLWK